MIVDCFVCLLCQPAVPKAAGRPPHTGRLPRVQWRGPDLRQARVSSGRRASPPVGGSAARSALCPLSRAPRLRLSPGQFIASKQNNAKRARCALRQATVPSASAVSQARTPAETGVVEPACRVVNSSSTDPACFQVVISLTSRESAVRNAYRSPLSVTLARTRIS